MIRAGCDLCAWRGAWSPSITAVWHAAVMHQFGEHRSRSRVQGWASIVHADDSPWVEYA